MAGYGHAAYGNTTYGLYIEPVGSDIGGLIRFYDEESVPIVVRVETTNTVTVTRTALSDDSIALLRILPQTFEAMLRVEGAFGVEVSRTDLLDSIGQMERTEVLSGPALIRQKGEDVLEIEIP